MPKDFVPPDGRSYEIDKDNNIIAIDGVKVKPKSEEITNKKKGVIRDAN